MSWLEKILNVCLINKSYRKFGGLKLLNMSGLLFSSSQQLVSQDSTHWY